MNNINSISSTEVVTLERIPSKKSDKKKSSILSCLPFFQKKTESSIKITNAIQITDPINNIITLNSHGSYSNDTFSLPHNIYILAPHPEGFNTPYKLGSPPRGRSFEEIIYASSPDRFPTPTSGGWHLYTPGEKVRNVIFKPWGVWGAYDPVLEYSAWSLKVPKSDLQYVKINEHVIPHFAVVPARNEKQEKINYKGLEKFKIKVFAETNLKEIAEALHLKSPNEPVILIPFTCNNKNESSQHIFLNGDTFGSLPRISSAAINTLKINSKGS